MRTGREQPENPKLRFTSAKRKSNADSRKSSSESTNEIEYSLTKGHRGLPYRWNRRRSAYAENRLNIPRKMVSASKTKVVKMTLSVIIAFICCWSPYFIIGLIRIYSGYQIKLSVMYSVSELLAMLHSALNPVLYGMFSTQSAMKMFKSTSNIWCCIKKRRTSSTSTLRNGCGVEHTLSNYDSGIFATNYNKYTLSGVQRHQVIMNKNICGNHHGERIFCDEYQDKKACCSGCTRLFNKFCFYCSCGKNKAQQFYADSHFLQQACVRGRCSANTDSTVVDSTVGNDPMATTTPNDIQLHEVQEGQLVYHSLPVRTNCSCV